MCSVNLNVGQNSVKKFLTINSCKVCVGCIHFKAVHCTMPSVYFNHCCKKQRIHRCNLRYAYSTSTGNTLLVVQFTVLVVKFTESRMDLVAQYFAFFAKNISTGWKKIASAAWHGWYVFPTLTLICSLHLLYTVHCSMSGIYFNELSPYTIDLTQ